MKVKEVYNCKWLILWKFIYGFPVRALTIYPFIFYRNKKPRKFIKKHEWVHVKQVEREGIIKFSLNYGSEYFRNRFSGMKSRKAYWNISYEKEARRKSIRNLR